MINFEQVEYDEYVELCKQISVEPLPLGGEFEFTQALWMLGPHIIPYKSPVVGSIWVHDMRHKTHRKDQPFSIINTLKIKEKPAFIDDDAPSNDLPHRITLGDPWPRADPVELAAFDPTTKTCTMNCGPASDDPRSSKERKFLCKDC